MGIGSGQPSRLDSCQIAIDKMKKFINTKEEIVAASDAFFPFVDGIEKLVQSLLEFSEQKILVYGIDCEVPFDYPNIIKRTITVPKISEHDKWYWKQWSCIEALKEDFENFVWVDGDVVVNHNIDNIRQYFNQIENYPIADIHVQEEFFGMYDNGNKSHYLMNNWQMNGV